MPSAQIANAASLRPFAPTAIVADQGSEAGLRLTRPALVQRLMAARHTPLVLIVAPPGYGKTSLCAEWAQSDGRPFMWTSADDPPHQLPRTVQSLQAQHSSFVLVIDAVDQLEPSVLSAALTSGLRELPAESTIALVSRTEPQLPLGRMRAHRMLTEIRTADLSMTLAEAEALFRREGLDLSLDDVRRLVERTEGWPAMLYLASLAISAAPGETVSFNGRHQLVFEYLRDELLAGLPANSRRFAIRTSILDELSARLCDHVLERRGSGMQIAALAQLTPLLVAVDPEQRGYRWHGLVRDALRSELERIEPEVEPALERRASDWYAHAGDRSRAIQHAAAAGESELAGDLMADNLVGYLTTGRNQLVDDWLTTLGTDQVAAYAPLALSASLSCLTAGHMAEAERWSLVAGAASERGQAGHRPRTVAAGLAMVQALAARTGVKAMGTRARSAADSEPRDSQWRPLGLFLQGVSAHLTGDRTGADRILDEAVAVAGAAAPSLTSLCLAQRAMIAMEEKDWELATELSDRTAMVIGEWQLTDVPISALGFAAAAAARAHAGRIDEAKADLRRGVDRLATLGDFLPWYGAETRILLAHASLWLADVTAARTLLAEASRLARKVPDAVIFGVWFEDAWAYMDTLAETRMAGPSSLTIAELRILRFLPSHRSFREIAVQLGVSANTVKSQAHAVYRKLGAASRSEAVEHALDAGLLG